ncbi:MAG: hypothetical protein RLZZ399_2866 [Verrucomicrobiota bacterium]
MARGDFFNLWVTSHCRVKPRVKVNWLDSEEWGNRFDNNSVISCFVEKIKQFIPQFATRGYLRGSLYCAVGRVLGGCLGRVERRTVRGKQSELQEFYSLKYDAQL